MRIQQLLFLTAFLLGSITLVGSQMSDSQARTDELQRAGREQPRQKETCEEQQKTNKNLIKHYGSRFLLGFIHGLINNYLSKGEPNQHFFKAPLREWVVGAGFWEIARLFKIPRSGLKNLYVMIPLILASRGGGQALGEMVPLNGHWRNFATNQWIVGIPLLLGSVRWWMLEQRRLRSPR